jgi:hypothetical protein
MRFSHFTAGILIVMLHLVVPLALILWTWIRSYTSITAWVVQILVLISYVAFIFLMGSWVYASFYLRYIIIILTITATLWSFMHARSLPLFITPHFSGWVAYGAGLIVSAVLSYFIVGAVRAHFYDETPVTLAFPFKNGTYAVFEGGNGKVSSLMNYHYGASIHQGARTNLSMRYAVDITKVTRWGNDADGFLPMKNERYAVFNQVVYSPCDGEVSEVEDKWPNETPWSGKAPYNVGNHILITSNDFAVLMGHLQKGSMLVKPGDRVTKGQPIAQAGNSGWTSQPHLHIQAMKKSTGSFWGWEGLPIFFDGKNPIKNSLFFEH